MSSGSLDGSAGSLSTADASEGSRLRRTFTLPRNPFSAVRGTKREPFVDGGAPPGGDGNGGSGESGVIERKLFRRGSWKRFISRIAHHMNTVAVPGVKNAPVLLKGETGRGEVVGGTGTVGTEPPWPAGAVPAATGIRNHGNTCYMNAVLQCLSHTDIIAEYFVLDHYRENIQHCGKDFLVKTMTVMAVSPPLLAWRGATSGSGEKTWKVTSLSMSDLLKRNKINSKKYGTRGEVTEQLAALLKSLWACQYSSDMSTSFKSTVERHGTQYRGNSQHDAQEFLFWLLDKVHEDLNTATKKKYKTIKNTSGKPDEVVAAETLANHARRNSSFVQAVFQAQYRSALTCGRCERTSCTFDPFHCVSVQLPPRHSAAQPSPLPVTVVYVNQQPRQVRIGLELSASATMEELRSTLHVDTGIPVDNIILAEISDAGWQGTRGPWEGAGADIGQLYCIEAPSLLTTPTAPYILLLWLNMLDGERFGSVYAMQVPRETSYADLQKLMLKEMAAVVPERVLTDSQDADIFRARVLSLAHPHLHDDDSYLQPELPHPLFALGVEQALCTHDTHPHLRLELHWDARHRNSIMSETVEACEVHVSAERGGAEGEESAPARPPLLTLHACLAHYTRAETLAQEDAWRCPQCQRYMPVVKTLGLWSLPDVLVIHLKRFRQQAKGRTSTKLTTMVEFPLTDFDMTPHLVRRSSAHESPGRSPRRRSRIHSVPASENVYDLYAVCYHHGDDLETGHYTAACKNPYNGQWYKFDDARVTLVPEDGAETELVNNTAYMLFYRRKKPNVAHVRPGDSHAGHWALRMPKYVKKQKVQMNGITESKEEAAEEMKEEPSECEVTVQTHSPSLSRSASSLPDDGVASPAGPRSATESRSPSVRSPVKLPTPTIANVSTVEINGNVPELEEDRLSVYENVTEPELYIHKDVHINPKMTPEIGRESASQRPRSVDYPTRAGSLGQKDMNRNYESSPYVASINGLEYDNSMSRDAPTTEELVLSMFHNETKYMMSRHQNMNAHRTGEDATAWKTRIST